MVKFAEDRNSPSRGPYAFPSAEAREDYVKTSGDVFWFFYVEADDWTTWYRGGAWTATAPEDPQDRKVVPPEITEEDRW